MRASVVLPGSAVLLVLALAAAWERGERPPPTTTPPALAAPATPSWRDGFDVLDEEARPTFYLRPAPDGAFALVDFTGHTFGWLRSSGQGDTRVIEARDAEGNTLAALRSYGDLVDGGRKVIARVRHDGAHTRVLAEDGHMIADVVGDDVRRDGELVRTRVVVRPPGGETGSTLASSLFSLAELPFEARVILAAELLGLTSGS
jgi:hypothetical protein